MIELRIVEHELGVKPEIQYRFVLSTADASVPFMNTSMNLIMPNSFVWSEWKTAPYVKVEDTSQTGTGALENRCPLSYNTLIHTDT